MAGRAGRAGPGRPGGAELAGRLRRAVPGPGVGRTDAEWRDGRAVRDGRAGVRPSRWTPRTPASSGSRAKAATRSGYSLWSVEAYAVTDEGSAGPDTGKPGTDQGRWARAAGQLAGTTGRPAARTVDRRCKGRLRRRPSSPAAADGPVGADCRRSEAPSRPAARPAHSAPEANRAAKKEGSARRCRNVRLRTESVEPQHTAPPSRPAPEANRASNIRRRCRRSGPGRRPRRRAGGRAASAGRGGRCR